jgi:serine/threonine-protein kinase
VAVGTVVAGKFRVERILAEGGMGVVVAAIHLQLDQPVALKFLREEVSADKEALARFTREAKAAARLRSEHVARVLDVSVTSDGIPYMVMEYLEGLNLYSALEALGPLDITSATEYAIQACEGLAEAHARGIVHRDIKPDNLFLVERAGWHTIKILDFGISKLGLVESNNLATGIIMGSPCYMSPEQLRSTSDVDHRTDIWSLGATLYELLTGHPAFDPSYTLPELVDAIQNRPVRAVRDLRPEVPEALGAIVERCLAKDRDARFESAGALAKALVPFAPQRAGAPADRAASLMPAFPMSRPEPAYWFRPPESRPSVVPPHSVSTPPISTVARTARQKPTHRRATFALSAAAIFIAVVFASRLERLPPPNEPVAPNAAAISVASSSTPAPQETHEPALQNPVPPVTRTAKPSDPRRRAAPAPLASSSKPPKRVAAPTTAPSPAPPPPPSAVEVSPAGGHAPLRPIETQNPFGAP